MLLSFFLLFGGCFLTNVNTYQGYSWSGNNVILMYNFVIR